MNINEYITDIDVQKYALNDIVQNPKRNSSHEWLLIIHYYQTIIMTYHDLCQWFSIDDPTIKGPTIPICWVAARSESFTAPDALETCDMSYNMLAELGDWKVHRYLRELNLRALLALNHIAHRHPLDHCQNMPNLWSFLIHVIIHIVHYFVFIAVKTSQ